MGSQTAQISQPTTMATLTQLLSLHFLLTIYIMGRLARLLWLWLPPANPLFIHCSGSQISLSFPLPLTASGFTGEARNFGSSGSVNSTRATVRGKSRRDKSGSELQCSTVICTVIVRRSRSWPKPCQTGSQSSGLHQVSEQHSNQAKQVQ